MPISAAADTNPVLKAALFYSSIGWSVVPTHRSQRLADGRISCTCNLGTACSSPGKHPAVAWEQWQHECASEARITDWFTGPFRGYGVGIVTGRVSGIFVIDVDEGEGKIGGDTLHDLQLIHGDLPDTVQARTGGGGRHIILRHPGEPLIITGKNVLGPGVDVRGDGGFVVAAPSTHQSGRLYLWDERRHPRVMQPAPAPGWLVDMARQDSPGGAAGRAAPTGHGEIVRDAWGRVIDGRERYMVGVICGAIASQIRATGTLPEPEAVFTDAWPAYERNARPRGASLEADHRGETLMRQRIAHMLRRAASGKWRVAEQIAQERESGEREGSDSDQEQAGEQEPDPVFRATPFDPAELATLRARQWVYAQFLIRKFVSVLGAPGGTGKTSYAIGLALAVVLNRMLLGETVHDSGPVWLYILEDPRDEILRRVQAACIEHGIDPETLRGRLYLDSGRDRPLIIAQRQADGSVIATPVVKALVAEIKRRDVRLLIIDPFVRSHRADENKNDQVDAVAALWARVADEANCAVLLCHHFRKGGGGGDADAFRGASALIDASRAALSLSVMSAEEAGRFQIELARRKLYVRIDNAKLSLAPPPEETLWLELRSVQIDTGDNVQAAFSWQPPSVFDGLSWATIARVLDQIEKGPAEGECYSAARQSDRWAGSVLMAEAGVTEEQAKSWLATWIRNGVLEKHRYSSPSHNRKKIGGLRVNRAKADEMRREKERQGAADE